MANNKNEENKENVKKTNSSKQIDSSKKTNTKKTSTSNKTNVKKTSASNKTNTKKTSTSNKTNTKKVSSSKKTNNKTETAKKSNAKKSENIKEVKTEKIENEKINEVENKKNDSNNNEIKKDKTNDSNNNEIKKDKTNDIGIKSSSKNNISKKDAININNESETKNTELKAEIPSKDSKQIISIFEKVIILVAVALVFSLIGYFLGNKDSSKNKNYSIAGNELQTFIEQYNEILENYYTDVDKEQLIKGAISGMLSTLDGYSQVIDDSSNSFTITLEGSYEGLGIEIINDSNGNIVIYGVYDDTPASRADIKTGDILKKINGIDLTSVSTSEFVKMVSNDTKFEITLLRDNKEITVKLEKEKIELQSVESKMLENNIGYISVSIFANNTYKQFEEALTSLENQKMEGLIIDLRNNTGGHLNVVKQMLGLFLDSSHIIYKTENKDETAEYYSNGSKDKKYSIVILQNGVSASASEIMASALREQLSAYIIGTTSYGKGTVQQLMTVEGIGQYKFTTKKWLTSKGVWIEGVGIEPDLKIELDDNYYKNPTEENDTQFQKAIEYLNER